MQPVKKLNPIFVALIVIVLIGVAVTAAVIAKQPKETAVIESTQAEEAPVETPAVTPAPTQNETPVTTPEKSNTFKYKNGTYTQTGRYISPGGAESIGVTITVTDDVITAASVTANARNRESKEHQQDFIGGYKSLVVGKNVDQVSLSRVAGASLTSNGFNAALKLIKANAQA